MRRSITRLGLAAFLLVASPSLFAQTPEEMAQTARYVEAFQNSDGGFADEPGGASSLGATSSALKILKNVGGSVRDVPGCIQFVKSCFDPATGGFSQSPGGKPDVHTTAVGLMAAAELFVASDDMVRNAVGYLGENVKTFPDVRIAVAGLEAVKARPPKLQAWTDIVNEGRHDDGTWGEGANKAFETGGRVVALLRMGVELDHRAAMLTAIKDGQRPDGAWSTGDGPSDLSATYRVMRGLFMMKESADLDALRSFIARCRQSDGGYGVAPGRPPTISGTYYATTVLHWARLLSGEPAVVETAGFQPLFNGSNLDGWEGDKTLWKVKNGMLVAESPGIKHNDFLMAPGNYRDFVLKFSFRLIGGKGNSGVQFRSKPAPPHEMSGYQADIGENYWGCLYDESRRNRVLVQASDRARKAVNEDGWNHYVIRAMGNHITLTLNGVTSVDYRETEKGIAPDGRIAVQVHAGGPMEVQFKDMYIQPLPTLTDDPSAPGFHLRTVKTDDGERKYTVFLPKGYDGKKTYPVVLFLHGSGERGTDGVISAQVGLGAVIAGHPDDFPFIALFPQARETWRADSDDAKAALAALDDVLASYQGDPDRVILTGLSMGGSGSWSIASAHPDRFIAVAPVCGTGDLNDVAKIKHLPVWTFVGDADRLRTVESTRSMVWALKKAGASPRSTEYRGVGHNSWDRAYSDPNLIEWMLQQTRKP